MGVGVVCHSVLVLVRHVPLFGDGSSAHGQTSVLGRSSIALGFAFKERFESRKVRNARDRGQFATVCQQRGCQAVASVKEAAFQIE